MEFGPRLRKMRKLNNMTLKELADKLEVGGKSTIAGYENGTRKPSYERLIQIAKIFNTSTDYLLGVTNNPTPSNDSTNLSHILGSNHFHVDGKELSQKDKDLFLSILERLYKEEVSKEYNCNES